MPLAGSSTSETSQSWRMRREVSKANLVKIRNSSSRKRSRSWRSGIVVRSCCANCRV